MTEGSVGTQKVTPPVSPRAVFVLLTLLTVATVVGLAINIFHSGLSLTTLPVLRVIWWVVLAVGWISFAKLSRRWVVGYVFVATVGLATAIAIDQGNVSDEPFVLLLIGVVTVGLEAGSRVALVCGALAAAGVLALATAMEVGVITGQTVVAPPSFKVGIFYSMSTVMITTLLVFGLRYGERLVRQVGSMNRALSSELEERKVLSEALLESQAELEAILQSAPVGVVTMDLDGRVQRFDGTLAEEIGAQSRDLASLIAPANLSAVQSRIDDLRTGEAGPAPIDAAIRRSAGGELECRVHFGIVAKGGDSDQVVLIIEDLTLQRRVERRLQSEKRHQDMGLIAGRVAHDFNNLMSAVLAQATVARANADRGVSNIDEIEKVKVGARTAAVLTQQLVAYAGNAPVEKELVDLVKVVETTRELFAVTLPSGVKLATVSSGSTSGALADLGQIQQVVMNLVLNASQAMAGREGTVMLTIGEIDLEPADLSDWMIGSSLLQAGRYTMVEVSDEGRGIEPEIVARMWEPFVTTEPDGHGLGLSVVLGIVRSHGGALQVATEVGRGTTIRFILPSAIVLDDGPVSAESEAKATPITA